MHYAWMDLETTGLDPDQESVLELGIAITDDQGNKIDLGPFMKLIPDFQLRDGVVFVVLQAQEHTIHKLHARVAEMHDRTGLSRDSLASNVQPQDVEQQVCMLISAMGFTSKDLTIAGNTIHFDARFLRKHLPKILDSLHCRQLDMSSVALFADTMGLPRPQKAEAHRVVADINESLAYFRFYRERLQVV